MAVTLLPTVSTLETRAFFHTKSQATAVKNLKASNVDCLCLPLNCEIPMPQFINRADQGNKDENDLHTFIDELIDNATIEITVTNLSTDTSTLIINDDYGNFFELGDFLGRPRVYALRVDWNKVFDQDGFGVYRFNFTVKNSSGTIISNEDSMCFKLQPFDCEAAAGTVRIEANQTGKIVGGFDYTGINTEFTDGISAFQQKGWTQQIRWWGRFFHETPLTEVDLVDNNEYGKDQVQQLTVRRFNLRLDFTRIELSKPMIEDHFMANTITISDYGIGQHDIIMNERVVLDEISDFPDEAFNKDITFNAKFSEYRQNKLKRNF